MDFLFSRYFQVQAILKFLFSGIVVGTQQLSSWFPRSLLSPTLHAPIAPAHAPWRHRGPGIGVWLVWKSEKLQTICCNTLARHCQSNAWGLVPPYVRIKAPQSKELKSRLQGPYKRQEKSRILQNNQMEVRSYQSKQWRLKRSYQKKRSKSPKAVSNCVICLLWKPTTYHPKVGEPRRYDGAWSPPSGRSDFGVPQTVEVVWRGKVFGKGIVSHKCLIFKHAAMQQ